MQVVEIDVIGFEPPQGIFTGPRYVLRLSFHFSSIGPWLAAQIAALGGKHDTAAPVPESLGEDLFVVAVTVIGGIDEVHADVDGTVQNGNGLLFISVAQFTLEWRAAIADRRNFQVCFAEKTVLHEHAPLNHS